MRVTMIGHATVLVETIDRRILMDPVLFDPFQEGIFEVFPPRHVDLAAMPAVDTLVVSHQHLDHLDIRSLAALPRDLEVFVPMDEVLVSLLRQLGYQRVRAVRELSRIRLGQTQLLTTPSASSVIEFGVVFTDASGTFWNVVDSMLDPRIIAGVRGVHPKIDLAFAPWQPLLEEQYTDTEPATFPFEAYGQLIQSVGLIDPGTVVPGSCGFRYVGASEWMNRVVFPVTRERFCCDARQAHGLSSERVIPLDPGDVITVDASGARVERGSSPFVTRHDDDTGQCDFVPVCVAGPPMDTNPYDFDLEQLERRVERFVTEQIPALVARKSSFFTQHRAWGVIHQLEVAGPQGLRRWTLDFRGERLEVRRGRDPLANSFSLVTASGLLGLLDGRHGWDYLHLGSLYRTYDKLYHATPVGLARPTRPLVLDPILVGHPPNKSFAAARARELERWASSSG